MKIYKNLLAGAASSALAFGLVVVSNSPSFADQVILDDLIVDGSICVGIDCANGESFGFDTLRLKENNLRIKFQDTSTSASFPSNDWQITANESSNGGLNKFSIDDIDGSRTPFTIEAGARNNALYVEADGDVGIGTNNPAVDLTVVSGNTPTLRLEQDGSSGFTPQTWDVAGNETNFFIRDATNGSDLPFRIFPNAGSDALTIEGGTGDVGIGTANTNINNSGDDLVVFDNGPARLLLFNNSQNGNKAWTLNSNNTLRISAGGDATEFELQENGNVEFGGTCIEFDANAGSRFACTFSAGGGVSCAAAGSSCP